MSYRFWGTTLVLSVLVIALVAIHAPFGWAALFRPDTWQQVGQAVGSILILGVTAIVVVSYTAETRRLAVSTEIIANSREALIAATVQPNLVIDTMILQGQIRTHIGNRGIGPAWEIECRIIRDGNSLDSNSPLGLVTTISVPSPLGPSQGFGHEKLNIATRDRHLVALSYKDTVDKRYHWCGRFGGVVEGVAKWIIEKEPMSVS